jgi:predicted DNA-binding transcriptional regulator AlpA
LSFAEVLEMTVIGKTFVYDRMTDGTFSTQIRLGPRAILWNERELLQWWEDRIASR